MTNIARTVGVLARMRHLGIFDKYPFEVLAQNACFPLIAQIRLQQVIFDQRAPKGDVTRISATWRKSIEPTRKALIRGAIEVFFFQDFSTIAVGRVEQNVA
jgi:hypothetical protein